MAAEPGGEGGGDRVGNGIINGLAGGLMFECDCCGLCCMNVGMSALYKNLDRGDGVCRYFNSMTKLCTIYDNRPDICNVDKMYKTYYERTMTKEEFYALNYEICRDLKRKQLG